MRRGKRARGIIALAAALTCTICGFAQAQISISLTPLLVELTAAPGETKAFDILLVNEGKATSTQFRVLTMGLAERQSGDYQVVESDESQYSCAKWIRLSTNEVTLGPGEGVSVTGTLAVPRGAYGGRYAAVVFELVPEKHPEGEIFASAQFAQRLVTVVEVSIPAPRVRRVLSISGFAAETARDNPRYANRYGKNALVLSALVKNEGNIHVFAEGFLTLRDGSGKRLRQIPLGSGRGLVLPEAEVNMVSVLPAGLAPGDYIADITVRYGGMRPAVAKVPFRVGDSGTPAKAILEGAKVPLLSVDPLIMELNYPPGAVAARSVVIQNRSDAPIHVESKALPLAYDEQGELVQEGVEPDTWSCAGWVEFRPASFDLAPGAKQVVRVLITIPKDQAGSRYANVVFTATPAGPAVTHWSGEAGTVVFLTVGKRVERLGELSDLKAEDGGPSVGWVFSCLFRNTGTTHTKPEASFTIRRRVVPEVTPGVEYLGTGSWEPVDSVELGELENVVLPGGTRLLRAGYARPLEPGDYRVEVSVNYGGKSPLYASQEFSVKQP